MQSVVVVQWGNVRVLQGLSAEEGDGLASPLSHSKVRMLRDDQQVAGDATPHDVHSAKIDLKTIPN